MSKKTSKPKYIPQEFYDDVKRRISYSEDVLSKMKPNFIKELNHYVDSYFKRIELDRVAYLRNFISDDEILRVFYIDNSENLELLKAVFFIFVSLSDWHHDYKTSGKKDASIANMWYNKKREIEDKGKSKDPVDGGQVSPYGKALYTRFEYRVNETDKPIAKLKSFTNHLPKVKFRAADYTRVKDKDYTHMLFLRYALGRTKVKALEMIPTELRKDYANTYDKAMIDIWKPKKIWDNGWQKELAFLGLYTPPPAKTKKKKK